MLVSTASRESCRILHPPEPERPFLHFFFSLSFPPPLGREKIFYLAEIIRSAATYARPHAINLFLLARARALSPPEVASRSSLLALAVESGNIPLEGTIASVDASANLGAPRTFCCANIIVFHFLSPSLFLASASGFLPNKNMKNYSFLKHKWSTIKTFYIELQV